MRFPRRMRLIGMLVVSQAALAQTAIDNSQSVATDSPEAWAMRYFTGTALMTSFGETAALAPWRWNVALDIGSIPHLSEAQQRVGFGGFKNEDLNKSPAFGRARLGLGLPHDWVAELGYTPPLEIDGSRARNVFALALGRRIFDSDGLTLSLRALGQIGEVRGDITCPARLAGLTDPLQNPYRCQAPSNDRLKMNYGGIDATLGWDSDSWQWYASAGIVQTRLSVQVDAELATGSDHSKLTASGALRYFTLGVRYEFNPQWSAAVELLYVPLNVRRPPEFALDQDSLTSVRVQLRCAID